MLKAYFLFLGFSDFWFNMDPSYIYWWTMAYSYVSYMIIDYLRDGYPWL